MSDPDPNIEQLLLAVNQLYHKDKATLDAEMRDALARGTPLAAIPNPFATVMEGIRRIEAQDAELATLRARVAKQDAWRAEREANADPDVNAARYALRLLSDPMQMGMPNTSMIQAGDRIAVVIEAYVDQIRWRAQAEPLLRRMMQLSPERTYHDYFLCPFHCKGDEADAEPQPAFVTHTEDCPLVVARALLGEGGQP